MDQTAWHTSLGNLVKHMGSDGFPSSVSQTLREIALCEYVVIFGYYRSEVPICLFHDFPPVQQKIHVDDYQEGPYLLDPFFLATARPVEPGFYRLRELAPDRFFQGEYYKSYYQQTKLAEEVGIFVNVGEAMIVMSLMRTQKAFSAFEMRKLRSVSGFFEAAIAKHWNSLPERFQNQASDKSGEGTRKKTSGAFNNEAFKILTSREMDVVEHTLKGFSAEATGRVLGIATGTVRIHKRNIYAKLRINSQGQLFSLFFKELG